LFGFCQDITVPRSSPFPPAIGDQTSRRSFESGTAFGHPDRFRAGSLWTMCGQPEPVSSPRPGCSASTWNQRPRKRAPTSRGEHRSGAVSLLLRMNRDRTAQDRAALRRMTRKPKPLSLTSKGWALPFPSPIRKERHAGFPTQIGSPRHP